MKIYQAIRPWPIAQRQGARLALRRSGSKSHSRHLKKLFPSSMLTKYYELLVSLLRQEISHGPQKDILGARRVEFVCGFRLHVHHLWNHTKPLRSSKLTSTTKSE